MSFNVEGKKCKCCNAILFEDDDVVFCPVCGAPHHRSCYNSLGHCALENLHGTDAQYDASKEELKNSQNSETNEKTPPNTNVKVKCGMCGNQYDATENACPDCHSPNPIKLGGRFVAIDFLGGVPADFDLGDGVTADEAKRFVLSNTHRFIPKFANMKAGIKASFNLLAFLFPCGWLLSRKMYKLGAFIGALSIAFSMLMLPFQKMLTTMLPEEVLGSTQRMAQYLVDNLESFNMAVIILGFAGTILSLIMMIVVGVYGDYFYRNYTLKSISSIKAESDDIEEDYRKKGGVSFIFMILGIFATRYLPVILASFAGL